MSRWVHKIGLIMRNIKTKRKLKIVSLLFALLLPIGTFAQGGLFQRGKVDNSNNSYGLFHRGSAFVELNNEVFGTSTGTDYITNETFDAPIGSGVLFLFATSASYAIIKSRKSRKNQGDNKMRKTNIILLAFALLAIMNQCKKDDTQNVQNNTEDLVTITLDVHGKEGLKVDVNTTTGTVTFESGDIIHVGSGGKYVGALTCDGDHHFVGNIMNPTEGQPLHFYFLGNVSPIEALASGSAEEGEFVISDQTMHLPVVSYAPSNENYSSGTSTYTSHLLNKCALVKFNVTTESDAATCIKGLNNKVTIDFTDNTITFSQAGEGEIMLSAGSGDRWAVLLPQASLDEGVAGSAYASDGAYTGVRPALPEIDANGYYADGYAIVVNLYPGNINGKFSVGQYRQVYFSKGNLRYYCNTAAPEWRFADNQYDLLPFNGSAYSSNSGGWLDMFGWATSGYNHGGTYYQPWITDGGAPYYYAYGDRYCNLSDRTGTADWGYNAISNGGATENQWRTLASSEWRYLLDVRTTTSYLRYAKAKVNGVNGMVLLPDDWDMSYYHLNSPNYYGSAFTSNIIDADTWASSLESHGAVFLPAAGWRNYSTLYALGEGGIYWTSTCDGSVEAGAYAMFFASDSYSPEATRGRHVGYSVRLVHDVE